MGLLTENSISYTINQLFQIAGIKQGIKSTIVEFDKDNCMLKVSISANIKICIKLMNEVEIEKLLRGNLILKNINSFDNKINVPMFFTTDTEDFASIIDGEIIINSDIITISFIVLSRYEEIQIQERDNFDRFQYKNSLAFKYNFIDIPIVDEYAMLLRMTLVKTIPSFAFCKRNARVIPTHDIDNIQRFGSIFRNIKTIIGGDLISRRSIFIALKSLRQCIDTLKDAKNDPLILAIKKFVQISKNKGLCSIFYFKGLRIGDKDFTYDIYSPEVKHCMEFIKDAGMIVGMHGGLNTYDNSKTFHSEKTNIEIAFGEKIEFYRQHFLLFDINKSIQVWQNCEVRHDSSLGYNEREGFRCGTCHEYYLYDIKNDCISNVLENPLIVMEKTLFKYRVNNIKTALAKIEKLYERCKAVEGDFVILWHNEMVFRDYEKKFRDVYCKFMASDF